MQPKIHNKVVFKFDEFGALTVVLTLLVSLCVKVFEASDFGSHPLFSVAQGGVDLQQVSMAALIFSPFQTVR